MEYGICYYPPCQKKSRYATEYNAYVDTCFSLKNYDKIRKKLIVIINYTDKTRIKK